MMTRTLLAVLAVGFFGVPDARAEYRRIELTIYGMD
jgi:hypothetical protein